MRPTSEGGATKAVPPPSPRDPNPSLTDWTEGIKIALAEEGGAPDHLIDDVIEGRRDVSALDDFIDPNELRNFLESPPRALEKPSPSSARHDGKAPDHPRQGGHRRR